MHVRAEEQCLKNSESGGDMGRRHPLRERILMMRDVDTTLTVHTTRLYRPCRPYRPWWPYMLPWLYRRTDCTDCAGRRLCWPYLLPWLYRRTDCTDRAGRTDCGGRTCYPDCTDVPIVPTYRRTYRTGTDCAYCTECLTCIRDKYFLPALPVTL